MSKKETFINYKQASVENVDIIGQNDHELIIRRNGELEIWEKHPEAVVWSKKQ
jgi:hypothetical protein